MNHNKPCQKSRTGEMFLAVWYQEGTEYDEKEFSVQRWCSNEWWGPFAYAECLKARNPPLHSHGVSSFPVISGTVFVTDFARWSEGCRAKAPLVSSSRRCFIVFLVCCLCHKSAVIKRGYFMVLHWFHVIFGNLRELIWGCLYRFGIAVYCCWRPHKCFGEGRDWEEKSQVRQSQCRPIWSCSGSRMYETEACLFW